MNIWLYLQEEANEPVKAVSQFTAVPVTTAYTASGTVPASEADSCRIYGSSYSGVSFGSGFSPDNLLLTDRRPVRSRSHYSSVYNYVYVVVRMFEFCCLFLALLAGMCQSITPFTAACVAWPGYTMLSSTLTELQPRIGANNSDTNYLIDLAVEPVTELYGSLLRHSTRYCWMLIRAIGA